VGLWQETLAMLRRAVKRASSMLGVARPSPHKKISRFWQVMGIAGFTVGALSFVTALALGQGYLRSAPKVPQLRRVCRWPRAL
jgi:hypothetical protein